MDEESIRRQVLAALASVAPEIEPQRLRSDRPLREEVDLDSMDWLRFLGNLHQATGVSIPEADYRHLDSVDAVVAYLRQRMQSTSPGSVS
ncbi:acyl carrier protein [Metapseudomonas lalkuanensis]|uniref:Acyl carrier protein n=1 Tax=Metapseudomonas lalkuanensis TaxID=2604832 RepID=A0A5J6QMV3_9GAMM|nr:acyl carrier protein [Pseudomonas lalkuanensis]QEY63115.1 acyl carrier protein [Pseudomonas lalkuanensis]